MVTSSSAKSRSQVRSDWTASAKSGNTSISGTVTASRFAWLSETLRFGLLFLRTVIDAEVIGAHGQDSFLACDFLVSHWEYE